jgi:DNA topoisomerase-3
MASPAQLLYAKKIGQEKGLVIPDEAKANSAAMSAWIDSNRSSGGRKRGRKITYQSRRSAAQQTTAPAKRARKRKGVRPVDVPATSEPPQKMPDN